MKATQIRKKAVVSIAEAEKVGTINDLILNPDKHHVEAFWVKTEPEGIMKVVPTDAAQNLGRDALTIRDRKALQDEYAAKGKETVRLDKLQGSKVITHSGTLVGTVSEVEVDPSNFEIVGYEVNTGGLPGLVGAGRRKLSPNVNFGEDILMIPDSARIEPSGKEEHRKTERGKKAA
ncbi:MAG: PRC-barrel domain-containing protein [Firmicutes bacterium]|nr:PRC-barrel domain-containing protein [Bacillota bacterium]